MIGCKCGTDCSKNGAMVKLGLDVHKYDYVIALAGNPNTGKTTVFNALTGLRQHTGNWPGKTVVRSEGAFYHQGKKIKIVDLPGTYSLLSTSDDEEIARNFILFGKPDCTVVVVDSTSLERNLNLVLQVLEITDKVVVALNLIDEAERRGLFVDARKLAKELGVPVIPTAAREGRGLDRLIAAVEQVVEGRVETRPKRIQLSPEVEQAVSQLVPHLQRLYPNIPNHRWLALRLLEGDPSVETALMSDEFHETLPAPGEPVILPGVEAAFEV